MKSKYLLIIGGLFCTVFTLLYSTEYFFYVQFADKHNSPYTLTNPGEYLSARSLARRKAFQINPDTADLPVNPAYVEQVNLTGVEIHSRTKWLNGITIYTSDSSKMSLVRALPFVQFTQFTGHKGTTFTAPRKVKWDTLSDDYGSAMEQMQQVNGQILHENNATGSGILIGVLDAGFKNADINPAFANLWATDRIVGHISIVEPSLNVFNEDTHGATVLSIMGGHLPDYFKGTAPNASYLLIQTEFVPSEYLSEVDFWVRGIEYADSVGVDIINSSLGYTQFDDPLMNYRYSDMNGRVSRASIAAEIAAAKGIIVCNSAGNDGQKPWRYIGAPADARNILTIGSVDKSGNPSSFTSFGPTYDQRTKPEITARGSSTAVVNSTGAVSSGNGTSFSSPLIAGLMACYLQLLYDMNALKPIDQIIQSVVASASHYESPTQQMGYGIPDFSNLPELIPALSVNTITSDNELQISIDNTSKKLFIQLHSAYRSISVYNITGQQLIKINNVTPPVQIDLSGFSGGIYLLNAESNTETITRKFIL